MKGSYQTERVDKVFFIVRHCLIRTFVLTSRDFETVFLLISLFSALGRLKDNFQFSHNFSDKIFLASLKYICWMICVVHKSMALTKQKKGDILKKLADIAKEAGSV